MMSCELDLGLGMGQMQRTCFLTLTTAFYFWSKVICFDWLLYYNNIILSFCMFSNPKTLHRSLHLETIMVKSKWTSLFLYEETLQFVVNDIWQFCVTSVTFLISSAVLRVLRVLVMCVTVPLLKQGLPPERAKLLCTFQWRHPNCKLWCVCVVLKQVL